MTTLRLRDSDRALALIVRGTETLWHPERALKKTYGVWRACIDREIERLGIRIHSGPLADAMKARAMAWTRRDIAINDGDDDWHDWDNTVLCPKLTEEVRHAFEIPFWDGRFQGAYVFSPRSRWAIEMQASLAIVRWYREMGARRENVVRFADRRAASFAKSFPGYNLGRIVNLKRETTRLILDVFDRKAA